MSSGRYINAVAHVRCHEPLQPAVDTLQMYLAYEPGIFPAAVQYVKQVCFIRVHL